MSLEDIKLATQDFHDDNCIGGGGSFGRVYKGKVPHGDGLNTIVAKLLNTRLGQEEKLFWNELQILLEYKHENIIGLVGYCDETDEKVIVYEYAQRRSLDRYVSDASLTWIQRLNICIDVASALDFLHRGREATVIAHGDIKTTNILLNDDWKAKLSGFGLSLINPLNQETNCNIDHSCGTLEHLDLLYIKSGSGFSNKEADIHSFGVVLFEILCGRSTNAIHKYEGHYLPDFIRKNFEEGKHDEIVLKQIKEQIVPKSLTTFQTIAYQCLHQEREKRPTSKEVLMELKKALEIQEERVQCPNMEQIANRLEILSRELRKKNLEHLRIPFSDIKLATNFFSEKHKVASWYDYTLYRAELSHFDKENPSSAEETKKCESLKRCNTVIIKRISYRHEVYKEKHFYKEVGMLTSVKHPNIVSLLGFCVEGSDMILIVDNASNGYLSQYLGNINTCILNWEKRLKICIDVAHALCYLHFEMGNQNVIIHGDINSRHIALDENFGAKIADFWDSAFLPQNHKDEAIHYQTVEGRKYYVDPELEKTHKSKRASDVYSFGVVLFEILCGRTAYDPIYQMKGGEGLASVARRSYDTRTLEDMIDPVLKEETVENNFVLKRGPNKDSLRTFIEIAHHCVAETQDQRPTMKVVVKKLEKALLFQKKNEDNPKIPLENIKQATQNFHIDNCIGGGGFGEVYKGNLQDGDGPETIVAKRLNTRLGGQGEQEFLSELQILLEYKHENVIGLKGYCDEKGEKIIVFEHALRGSLYRHLEDASLTWVTRLNICIDVASALDFIHGGVGKQARVIHRDIKAANILLNHDWKAKLADFGLSLISPINQETNYIIDRPCGTRGYLDPLYEKLGFLTIESDVYSFGVVLFEMLCGRSTYKTHKHEGHYLPDFINRKFEEGKQDEVVMKQIREQMVPESLSTFQEIARQCLHHEREKRPATKNILWQLKKALEFQVSFKNASGVPLNALI
ncbi:uncharacterized protein LOC143609094 [Bidens hawaiensis]|uniref:uncharacterized protein LOC143609094 n=1 Tax=Bidens hawaiensis TaxID=980011 RepID=UPI00404AD48E